MRILWVKSELLHPIDKGGKIRTYQMLKWLKKWHDVSYICLRTDGDSADSEELAAEYCDRLITVPWRTSRRYSPRFYSDLLINTASKLPYAIQKYQSERMASEIKRTLEVERYDLLVCDFLTPAVNLPKAFRVPSLLFQHNVESALWERHYQSAEGLVRKAYFYSQFKKMESFERAMIHRFDAVVAVSDSDRRLMTDRFDPRQIYEVPTGVDTDFFFPLESAERRPSELVFTGSMDYLPNEDAVVYFADSILPLVSEKLPNVTLTIVGRNPSPRVSALAANPAIRVTGTVPDIRPYLATAAAHVVPIRIGGGTRLKIFEAMAMGTPVISTSIGAEGLPVTDRLNILIADTPAEFANRVIETVSDFHLRERLARNGMEMVTARFGWDSASSAFSRICENVATRQKRVRAA